MKNTACAKSLFVPFPLGLRVFLLLSFTPGWIGWCWGEDTRAQCYDSNRGATPSLQVFSRFLANWWHFISASAPRETPEAVCMARMLCCSSDMSIGLCHILIAIPCFGCTIQQYPPNRRQSPRYTPAGHCHSVSWLHFYIYFGIYLVGS